MNTQERAGTDLSPARWDGLVAVVNERGAVAAGLLIAVVVAWLFIAAFAGLH